MNRYGGLILFAGCLFLASLPAGAADASAPPSPPRPKIGLALGGGGALGFAHVGVLKILEQNRIPVDCIAGTSMGAIVAGLYASGMAPDEIETFLNSLDWWEVLKDQTPRRELYFRRKQDDQRYLFDLEVGLKRSGLAMSSGTAAGQKFSNLMRFATLRVADVTDFDALPIPYRAVATDLEAGTAVVLSRGNLGTAMRASMAVPGVFTPVLLDGRILVDGGLVDNIPVDVVRGMGADVVIAVDVGAPPRDGDEADLASLSGILGRTYQIMRRPHQDAALARADIVIQPTLTGFSASQFHRVADIIPAGAMAASNLVGKLAPYRMDEAGFNARRAAQRRPPPPPLRVSAIEVAGTDRTDERCVRSRIRSHPGEPLDTTAVELDLMRIYGIGDFEQVLFDVPPDGAGGYVLRYSVREKPWGPTYGHIGLRMDSDFENDADWQVLFNVTMMSLNRLGAEWRSDLEIGSSTRVFSEFYQPLDFGGIFFVAPNVSYSSEAQNVYEDGDRIAEYDVDKLLGRIDAGVQLRRYAELRAGPCWGSGSAEVDTGAAGLPSVDDEFFGGIARLTVDRQDRTLFAREGYRLVMEGQTVEVLDEDDAYSRLSADYRQTASRGDHTFIIGLSGGTSFASDLPGYAQFLLGGPHQFSGLAVGELRGQYLGVGSLGYRRRLTRLPPSLGRAVYAMARCDLGNVWQDVDAIDIDDTLWGASVGVGADTAMGPVYFAYGHAEGGHDRLYLSIGTIF